METEIISALEPFVNWIYGIIIIVIAEVIKKISVRQNDKKYVLRFDTDKQYPFNIRVPIVVISFLIGLGIFIVDTNIDAEDLFITFAFANLAYDYLYKIGKKKIKEMKKENS
jgi:hypothetical protein